MSSQLHELLARRFHRVMPRVVPGVHIGPLHCRGDQLCFTLYDREPDYSCYSGSMTGVQMAVHVIFWPDRLTIEISKHRWGPRGHWCYTYAEPAFPGSAVRWLRLLGIQLRNCRKPGRDVFEGP